MKGLKHPFGFLDDESVVPAEVEDGETVECPADGCDERLHVRGPSSNGTVRHFWHPGGGGGGSGAHVGGVAESPPHKNCKSHAASALLNFFSGFVEESTTKEVFEQNFEIGDTGRRRQADARVTFEKPHSKFGKGVIIEVQHKHRDKDIGAVTADYLSEEYSVFWTDTDVDYEGDQYLFDRDRLGEEAITVWPNAVPETSEWETVFPDIRCFTIDARGELVLDCPYQNEYGQIEVEKRVSLTRAEYPRWRAEGAYDFDFSRPYYSTSVQLPREFYVDIATDWFRGTDWDSLFEEYEWCPRVAFPEPDDGAKRNHHTDARYHREWDVDEEAVFRDIPWEELFSPSEVTRAVPETTQPEIESQIPIEWYEDDLKDAWRCGRGEFDLSYRLSKNHAPRTCFDCGEEAVAYIFTDGHVSKFVCGDCLPENEESSIDGGVAV